MDPRRGQRYAGLALALAAGLGAAGPTRAQELLHDDSAIGQRGLGLAGAFVGVADDASAAYHNPGGLALQPAGSASGSLAVSLFQGYTVDGGYRTALGDFDLQDDADPQIPSAFSVVVRLGRARGRRGPDHAIAIFYGDPLTVRRRFAVDAYVAEGGGTNSLSVAREDRWTLYGLSYAYRPLSGLGVGLTVGLVRRSFRHEEFESIARFEGAATDPTLTLSAARRSLVELSHTGLAFRLGGAWDFAPRWRLGVMFQPPAIGLSTRAEVLSNASTLGDPGGADVGGLVAGSVERPGAESPMPWQLRAGAAYQIDHSTLISFEGGLVGPQGSADDPVRFLGDPDAVDPETGIAPRSGLFVADAYHARLSAFAAAGAELMIGDRVPMQLGVRSQMSSAPPLPASSDQWRPDRLNGLGASLSLGLRTGSGDLSIGASGSWRWGHALAAREDRGIGVASGYERTDARAWSLLIFLTGSGRAAADAAGEVYDRTLRPIVGGDLPLGEAEDGGDDPEGSPEPAP